jgi:ribonuclease P protein component
MSAEPPSLRFPRTMRLKQSRDFAALRQQGERLVAGCLIVNWIALPAGSHSRVGVITSRKLGPAVTRNRSRRLLRESFRLHQHELRHPVSLVLVARASIIGKRLAGVESDFLAALRKARLLNTTE